MNVMQMFQMMNQLRGNPIGMLQQRGLNVPVNMNDPQQIVQYLMQSGQIPQARYQQAVQMARSMGVNL